jgi:signal transduction histidine kinase
MISSILADGDGDGQPDRMGDTFSLSGRITASRGQLSHRGPDVAVLQDETHGIHVRLPDGPLAERGDSLLIRGGLTMGDGLPMIDADTYSVVSSAPQVPQAVPLTVATASEGYYDGTLARVQGRVAEKGQYRGQHGAGRYLALQDPEGSSSARLLIFVAKRQLSRFQIDGFEEGERIGVTGVIGRYDGQPVIGPREAGDFVLEGKAWRYLWYTLLVVGFVVGVLAVVAMLWVTALRRAVDRRTRQLRTAKEKAEEAARLKSSMLANMSHEIRTPLTSIIGFAEAIGESSEAAERFAPLIEKSGKRLLETLDGVLNLSKLEAGQMELGEETVSLEEEAETLVEELRPQAEEAGIGCRVEANGQPVRARADKGGVQIALRNLVANAIKYTEDGEVVVRAYRDDETAVLEVEDTGIGMDPGRAEDLFEPFRQASEGMSREYEGTGVGLAVTKEAIDQMGGTIEVETEKGEGSRFTVRFPPANGGGDASNESRSSENGNSGNDNSGNGKRKNSSGKSGGPGGWSGPGGGSGPAVLLLDSV